MPGPIFLHCQTFSRKPSPAGNSLDQVIGEALRDPQFSVHVASPQPPRILLGNPATFRAEHDAHVAARTTEVHTARGIVRRRIRMDRHTLATIVASYPQTVAQIRARGEKAAAHYEAWERATCAWVRGRYGNQLRVVIAHADEEYPHLHFWLLSDDPGADGTTLHAGKVAKRVAEAKAKAAGLEPRAAVKAGNAALKVAMRGWLDAYHREVGVPLGLTRDGPKRRRLSRAQWRSELAKAEQEMARRQQARLDAVARQNDRKQLEETKAVLSGQMREVEQQKVRNEREADRLDQERLSSRLERQFQTMKWLEIDSKELELGNKLRQVDAWLQRPDLPQEAYLEGQEILKGPGPIIDMGPEM